MSGCGTWPLYFAAPAVLCGQQPYKKPTPHPFLFFTAGGRPRVVCRACGPAAPVRRVALPHVFRYLAAELAAMNIKTVIDLTEE